MGIIYKLIVGDWHYIGRTINSFRGRYMAHRKSCFNRSKTAYHSKVYKKFRELGVKKDNWTEMVQYKIIYECHNDWLDCYEYMSINVNNYYNLNTMNKKDIKEMYKLKIERVGTLSPEQRKINRKITNDINNPINNIKLKLNGRRKIFNAKHNAKHNGEKLKIKVFCEYCNTHSTKSNIHNHNRGVKHSFNVLMNVD